MTELGGDMNKRGRPKDWDSKAEAWFKRNQSKPYRVAYEAGADAILRAQKREAENDRALDSP